MPELKKGDIVQLKSGIGPKMTVVLLDNSAGEATCMWFEGKNRIEDIFDIAALQVVNKKVERLSLVDRSGSLPAKQKSSTAPTEAQ
jgi:uncharacterized protein YodC (DUF2158 family)